MMKLKIYIGMMLLAAICLTSCNNQRSYADMKKDQKKALEKFISEQGIEVLHKYPADGKFGEKQFYLDDNGLYINVVDSGNGNRAVAGKTTVLMRFVVEEFFKRDTADVYDFFSNSSYPLEFTYGYATTVVSQYSSNQSSPYYYYFSTGLENALSYVGENSTVKLIVPFEIGSTYQSLTNIGAPFYYSKVRFTFY